MSTLTLSSPSTRRLSVSQSTSGARSNLNVRTVCPSAASDVTTCARKEIKSSVVCVATFRPYLNLESEASTACMHVVGLVVPVWSAIWRTCSLPE